MALHLRKAQLGRLVVAMFVVLIITQGRRRMPQIEQEWWEQRW